MNVPFNAKHPPPDGQPIDSAPDRLSAKNGVIEGVGSGVDAAFKLAQRAQIFDFASKTLRIVAGIIITLKVATSPETASALQAAATVIRAVLPG